MLMFGGLNGRSYVLYSRLAGVKVSKSGKSDLKFSFFCLGNCFHLCKEGV